MTNISRKKLKNKVFIAIGEQLTQYIFKLNTKEKTKIFVDQLFTESEKIMIAKRFAVIVMMKYGYDSSFIKKTLKISGTTVYKIFHNATDGKYNFILNQIPGGLFLVKKKKESPLWEYIKVLLEMRMPPKVGRGRWKGFYDATNTK